MFDFSGKIVVITGGAQGIGKCIAENFSKQNAKVIVIDKITSDTQCDLFYEGDIAQENILRDFVQTVTQKYTHIDYLINNACFTNGGIFNSGYDEFLEVQKVGVIAPFMLTKLFMPYFSSCASIINISSTRAFQSQHNTECYSAAKGASSL